MNVKPIGSAGEPRVLVLLASYNGASWIRAQIDSIIAQRGVSVVLKVSDDNSGDNTRVILEELASSNSNVSVIIRKSCSGSAGANFRLLLAESDYKDFDYVALSDQDDIWDHDHLAVGCAELASNPAAMGYSCAVQTFGLGNQTVFSQSRALKTFDFLFEGAGQGCTFVMRSELASVVGQLCKEQPTLTGAMHYHDWLIYVIARSLDQQWIFDHKSLVKYRQHSGNEIGARTDFRAFRWRLSRVCEGWYRQEIMAALNVALYVNNGKSDLKRFSNLFKSEFSAVRRARLAIWTLISSRRKTGERAAIAFFALLGWL